MQRSIIGKIMRGSSNWTTCPIV